MLIPKPRLGYKLVKSLYREYVEIPDDWEKALLVNLGKKKLQYGASVSALPKNNQLPRYIRITDLNDDGSLRENEWASITEEDSESYLLYEGDILFARTGATVGKTYLYKKEDGNCAFAGYLIRFIPDEKKLSSAFLFHYTHSYNYWRWLKSVQTEGVQPNVNAEEYSQLPIMIPKKVKEQQKIASILSDVDSLMQQTQQVIGQIQKLKKGIMQKLLTKGIGHTKFEKVDLGGRIQIEIPTDWNVKILNELILGDTQNGYAISSTDYGKGFPIVGMTDIFVNDVLEVSHLHEVTIEEKKIQKFFLKEGDLIFARRSLNVEGAGKCVLVSKINKPTIFESSVIRMTLQTNKFLPTYVNYLLNSPLGMRIITRIKQVVAVSGITSSDLKKIKIPVPEKLDEQQQITSIFLDIDSKIQKYQKYKFNLETLKKGLMQNLLTGQMRVKI